MKRRIIIYGLLLVIIFAFVIASGGCVKIDPVHAKALTAYSFTSPAATGTINESAKTISVTVPYGTDVTALVATFQTTGASVKVGSTVQVSGTTPNDFTNPVQYTVTAADDSAAIYTVTVTKASSSAKALTAYSFAGPAASGIIDESARTVAVTVPYGTDVTALVAAFETTGTSVKVGSTIQVSGTTPNDFTNPVQYVVTAADGSTAAYSITVTVASSSGKELTAYLFTSPSTTGHIDESAKTITVTVPYNTDVTALVATFQTTGAAVTIGSTLQVSGTTPNDFTSPVQYAVTAADGTSAIYTVTVTIAASSEKALTAYLFTSPSTTGAINESAKTVAVNVPSGTDVTALVATFQTTGASVKVGSTIQVSGTTPNDFTSPVQYRVTAADGSTATYTVTVQIASNSNKTSWSNGRGNPQNTGYASWAGITTGNVSGKLRSLAVGTVAVNPEWIYTGSGSSNGSFPVIDQEGTIYYQGTDKCLYAVKSDGTLKWKVTNKNAGFVPPVIGPDGRIYVGDYQDWFYCLNPLDGQEIWSIDFGSDASGFVNAPIITPDGIIYISSLDGNLYALNLDGVLVWKFNQAYSVQGTPGVGQDGTVYTMTDRLYSLHPSSGSVNWSFRPADEPNSTGWRFESSPVIADNGTIYMIGFYSSVDTLGNIIYLFAVDSTGNEVWRYRLTDGSSYIPSGARTYPTLMPDGSILVSVSPTSTLVVINPNGILKTEKVMSQSLADEASPSIDGMGRVYISYRYGFACLSADLSSILWEKIITDGSNGLFVESSPSIGSSSVYFTVRDGNYGGSLYSFSLNP